MSILDSVQAEPIKAPLHITILGDSGVGKSSLAATFPKPILIRTEGESMPRTVGAMPPSFPMVDSVEGLHNQLRALVAEDHDYQTLIIDSVTGLESLFTQHVMDNDPNKPKSINQAMGGYGAGLAAVAALHSEIRRMTGYISERKGMNVVFLAHADTEQVDLPDKDPYTRYSLRLGKKSVAPYVDKVDCVGFIQLQAFVKGDGNEKRKAVGTGARELICFATPANVSKNRLGITKPIILEENTNPFAEYI